MEDKVGRNDPCPCGSGLKFKKCCFGKPPKLKFKATVIKARGVGDVNLEKRISESNDPDHLKEFKITNKDYTVKPQ